MLQIYLLFAHNLFWWIYLRHTCITGEFAYWNKTSNGEMRQLYVHVSHFTIIYSQSFALLLLSMTAARAAVVPFEVKNSNRTFPSFKEPHFQNEATKCKTFSRSSESILIWCSCGTKTEIFELSRRATAN